MEKSFNDIESTKLMSRSEIDDYFEKRLLSISDNKNCFECGTKIIENFNINKKD